MASVSASSGVDSDFWGLLLSGRNEQEKAKASEFSEKVPQRPLRSLSPPSLGMYVHASVRHIITFAGKEKETAIQLHGRRWLPPGRSMLGPYTPHAYISPPPPSLYFPLSASPSHSTAGQAVGE